MSLASEMESRFEQLARIGREEQDRDIYLGQLIGLLTESVLELADRLDELAAEIEQLRRVAEKR